MVEGRKSSGKRRLAETLVNNVVYLKLLANSVCEKFKSSLSGRLVVNTEKTYKMEPHHILFHVKNSCYKEILSAWRLLASKNGREAPCLEVMKFIVRKAPSNRRSQYRIYFTQFLICTNV